MPTTREASTPSRRAIRKAESTGTPVENHLQQRFQFTPPPVLRQARIFIFISCQRIFSHLTVEWGLASINGYASGSPTSASHPFTLLVVGLPHDAGRGPGAERTRNA